MLPQSRDIIWPHHLLSLRHSYPGTGKVFGEVAEPGTLADCPNCGGTGAMSAFVITDAVPDNKHSCQTWINSLNGFRRGFREWAPCPVCNGDSRKLYLERASGLTGADLNVRFETFRPMPGKDVARAEAARLLAMTPRPAGLVTFYGGYGVGKSHLLKALVNGFRVAGVVGHYSTMADILATVRETFGDEKADSGEELIRRYRHYPVLCIDEVDRVNLTRWASETLFRLLDDRYSHRDSVLTVLATNASPHDMPGLEYLSSRMVDGQIIEVGGYDVRGTL